MQRLRLWTDPIFLFFMSCLLLLVVGAASGCGDYGTDWESRAQDRQQAVLNQAAKNTEEFANLAEKANEDALFRTITDTQSDLMLWLERHPNATPAEFRAWYAEAVKLQSATLAHRLAALEELRDKREIAMANIDAGRRISEQVQSVNEAQMAFQERFKNAAGKIQAATASALQHRAEQRAADRAAKQARRAEFISNLQSQFSAATGVRLPGPASRPSK